DREAEGFEILAETVGRDPVVDRFLEDFGPIHRRDRSVVHERADRLAPGFRLEHREEGGGVQDDGVWFNVRHSESLALSARRSAINSSARLTPHSTFENRWRRRSRIASRFSRTSRCPSMTATSVSPVARLI